MKIITLLLSFFIISTSIYSQVKKNQWIAGGQVDYSHGDGDALLNTMFTGDSKVTSYVAGANGGYFFIDKLCGGLRFGAGGNKSEQVLYFGSTTNILYQSKSKVNSMNLSPFLRYYLLGLTQKVNFVTEAAYIYMHGTNESDVLQNTIIPGGPPSSTQSHYEQKFNSHGFSISAGPAIFLNSKVSLELLLKYGRSKVKETKQSGYSIGAGLGFQIHFGK